mmetsp:Transcript_2607/g.6479  ORF Transcript_2607/g.6479 Transcript_2607/m.6479 type:complete len:442 (-) Transcript_2607:231-1556(-)
MQAGFAPEKHPVFSGEEKRTITSSLHDRAEETLLNPPDGAEGKTIAIAENPLEAGEAASPSTFDMSCMEDVATQVCTEGRAASAAPHEAMSSKEVGEASGIPHGATSSQGNRPRSAIPNEVTAPKEDSSATPQEATVPKEDGEVSAKPGADFAQGHPWRLKFLHKVGIPPPGGVQEAPPVLQPSEGEDNALLGKNGSGMGADDFVVVRQAAPRRSSDDIRLGYIKKLENSRRFIPHLNRPKASQTVTIFDWDDTLLCTSHLEMVQRQYGSIPTSVREQLATLEREVRSLLVQAQKVGKVFIITNASEGWVQHSSSLCMPSIQADLAQVDVISARGAFESSFPGDSHAWKMHAFLQIQNKLQMEAVTNLLSVGDSHIEMDAVHLLGRSFAHALVKTVKLWERPTPYELQKQLEVVAGKLPEIYSSGTTLNIWLERETAQASS